MVRRLVLLLVLARLCAACPGSERYARNASKNTTYIKHLSNAHSVHFAPTPKDDDPGFFSRLSKRWYSVFGLAEIQAGHSTKSRNYNRFTHAPWPVDCGNQWVRYCFKNEHSADNLESIVAHAITLWAPASQYSGLFVQPDYSCYDTSTGVYNYHCICGVQGDGSSTAIDALVISDGRDSNVQSQWARYSSTTSGYDYTRPNVAGRHDMIFGGVNEAYDTDHWTPAEFKTELIRVMAHELGHAIGLFHEQQRPDARFFTTFNCRWLSGYDAAQARVRISNDPNFNAGMSVEERMEIVCTNLHMAAEFFPEATEYIDGQQYDYSNEMQYPGDDDPFDYGSIMIYSSVQAMRVEGTMDDAVANAKFPLLRKHRDGSQSIPASLIWGGGSEDRSRVSISAHDIQRVAALYPGTARQQARAAALGGANDVNWNPKRCGIAGLVDEYNVQPAPMDIAYADQAGNIIGDNDAPNTAPPRAGDAGDVAAAAMANLNLVEEEGLQG